MPPLQPGSFTTSLAGLFNKGLRYATIIDIGCADGNFFVDHYDIGMFPNAKPLNIDANALYEDSLRAIKDVFGGDYTIAAITDAPGEIEFTNSVHPYWASIRPPDDPYWKRLNGLHAGTTKVKAVTLDSVVQSANLKGPYLLKMDIQGAEAKAIAGARETLKETDAVIVEADIADFQEINSALVAADFSLYDLTMPNWLQDGSLGWFYPVYLNNRRSNMKAGAFWNPAQDQATIKIQVERRKALLAANAAKLTKHRALRGKT
ncbi:MAG: FkbM family methyltransferase [Afipia sp.]|nr:FkbM family methyltransferase [Afipia sp.]